MSPALLTWFWRAGPYLIGAALVAALLGWVHHAGVVSTTQRLDAQYGAQIAELHADADKQHAADLEAARTSEQAHGQALTAIESNHLKAVHDEKAKFDRTITDLRAGTLRLRDNLTCAADSSSLPSAATGATLSLDAGKRGLQPEDVETLVRIAADADQVAHQLEAAQAVIAADRAP
jgi:uncharacterized protein YciW